MVSCGGMHSVALTDTGEVWQWGEPWGDFSIEVNRSPRKLVTRGIVSITSGAFHNLALNSCNQVLAWGTNDFGQLGTGDTTYATEPTLTVGLDDVSVADISAGGWHSLALSSDGKVYTWYSTFSRGFFDAHACFFVLRLIICVKRFAMGQVHAC